MPRYSVTIVSPGTAGERPVLLIPFQPTAIVTAFVEELWKRVVRRGLQLEPNTHIATLHLNSESGAIIDVEDILSDVLSDPENDKVFAVFSKQAAPPLPLTAANQVISPARVNEHEGGEVLSIRVITPATAKDRGLCPVMQVSARSTIRQLHDRIAEHLHIRITNDEETEGYECNCKLASLLADGPYSPDSFFVVHEKSVVERLPLRHPTDSSLKEALSAHFGVDVEAKKKVVLTGAEFDLINPSTYKKPPVVSICSRQRHMPAHARVHVEESGQSNSKTLDLHTSELPIHPACMSSTIEDSGLDALAVNGVVDIFAVERRTTGSSSTAIGKSSIFRMRSHWSPRVAQSERGLAMFLSSLRVFTALLQDMRDDERSQDAVMHAFDLMTNFPPAVRALHILAADKTPTAEESAAISHAFFEVLDGFMPTDVIGSDHSRVFEGARLLFGFVLEKARSMKLPEQEGTTFPYLSSFQNVELRDQRTNESVKNVVQTSNGLVEASLFNAFQEGGLLVDSHLQSFMVKTDIDASKVRQALLTAGTAAELTVFSESSLLANYQYADLGNVTAAIDLEELSDLDHLAALTGRNKLAVHKPSQLASAVAPCLTFDRLAHLAVYTGEQPCGEPGRSSMVFRPRHGEETIDVAIVEQLIAPLLQKYEAEGTAIFDALGGASVRRLQEPDEVLMFCVDTSASMRQPTDFVEVNDDVPFQSEDQTAQNVVEADFYNQASFDDMKERLCDYEGFRDMIAIIAEERNGDKRYIALAVLDILRSMLSSEIVHKARNLEEMRQRARGWYYGRHQISTLAAESNKLKAFWAGLKTHEDAVCDFLIYRANAASSELTQRWTWSLGDSLPGTAPAQQIPSLEPDITELPHDLCCPISHTLMEDAVTTADGVTYSHAAIETWFRIRNSSPMTGLELNDSTVTANQDICDAARRWVDGDGVPGRDGGESKRLRSTNELKITFDSKVGSFQRYISPTMSLKDLYKLAFRGSKGKFITFQLSTDRYGPLNPSPEAKVSSRGISNGDHVIIRIADDDPTSGVNAINSGRLSGGVALVKVYETSEHMSFGYWVKRDTTCTLGTVLWKYWRHIFYTDYYYDMHSKKQVWTDMSDSGDNLLQGLPRETTDQLSTYLTRQHCFGVLASEPVFKVTGGGGGGNSGQDAPLVLKAWISSPWKPHRENDRLSRLDVLKQMFEALVNRMLAYNLKTHLGLVTFASKPQVAMGISHVLENFRKSTHSMKADGDTALWDAIALSREQLIEYGQKYPEAKKRIIVISDGADTKSSTNTASDICWRLKHSEIAVDSVSLGYEKNEDLRTLSYLLGCYRFHPTSLVNALAICEMENFLSLSERPDVSPPRNTPKHRLDFMGHFWNSRRSASHTIVTEDSVPPRKQHPNLDDEFVELASMAARPNTTAGPGSSTRLNRRITRLMNEMRQVVNSDHPTYDVYVSETDMSFWKVVLSGPEGSPYEDGVFLLYLHADEGYPTFAPKARFITKMKHPNVNMHGRICHSIFDRDWTSDVKMTTLLDTIYGLLMQPEYSDPVNTTTTLSYHHDEVEFADEVREHVDRYARKSRDDWKKELLGQEDDSFDEEDEEMDDEDEDEY